MTPPWKHLREEADMVHVPTPRLGVTGAFVALALLAGGCGASDDSTSGSPPTATLPTTVPPTAPTTTPPTRVPPSDCSTATVRLPAPTGPLDGAYTSSTDAAGSAMLITNTGPLTIIVVPANASTRLDTTPDVNPTDQSSVDALRAVVGSDLARSDPNIPPAVPPEQVFVVPPQWSVCALVDRYGAYPEARVSIDKYASSEYFIAKALSTKLISLRTPGGVKRAQTLASCATQTFSLFSQRPDLASLDLYADVLRAGSSCHSSYELLLEDDAAKARAAESGVLDILKKTPRYLENTEFVLALSRR